MNLKHLRKKRGCQYYMQEKDPGVSVDGYPVAVKPSVPQKCSTLKNALVTPADPSQMYAPNAEVLHAYEGH
jgi:hypothetical protein